MAGPGGRHAGRIHCDTEARRGQRPAHREAGKPPRSILQRTEIPAGRLLGIRRRQPLRRPEASVHLRHGHLRAPLAVPSHMPHRDKRRRRLPGTASVNHRLCRPGKGQSHGRQAATGHKQAGCNGAAAHGVHGPQAPRAHRHSCGERGTQPSPQHGHTAVCALAGGRGSGVDGHRGVHGHHTDGRHHRHGGRGAHNLGRDTVRTGLPRVLQATATDKQGGEQPAQTAQGLRRAHRTDGNNRAARNGHDTRRQRQRSTRCPQRPTVVPRAAGNARRPRQAGKRAWTNSIRHLAAQRLLPRKALPGLATAPHGTLSWARRPCATTSA